MGKVSKIAIVLGTICLLMWSSAALAGVTLLYEVDGERLFLTDDGRLLGASRHGGNLPNAPDYDWWYGCSPTSAGMMMGYYDINGYGGLCYTNLVPGGEAELVTFGDPGAIANDAIASAQHISDFWVSYGHPGPDPCNNADPTTCHSFNCLADFMRTSMAVHGSTDGSTWFYYYTDGSPVTPAVIEGAGIQDSGMYGVKLYVEYRNYTPATIYHQWIYGHQGNTLGFTAAQYRAEIDAGRPVLINVEGHSMFGYGYDYDSIEQMTTVYVHDTWDPYPHDPHTFTWGGYYAGMLHYAVMPLTVAGGEDCIEYPYCFQDQYGNQYAFQLDSSDPQGSYLYGTFYSGQGCDAPEWPLLGAYMIVNGKNIYEFSCSNPLGDADHCVPAHTIKGAFPNGAWYYTNGYGGQEFNFVPCGSSSSEAPPQGKGALK